jgi:primosomal protein N' (replication factor Y)
MVMSVRPALEPPKALTAWRLVDQAARDDLLGGLRMTPARQRVLSVLAPGGAMTQADLAQEAAVGPTVIKGMAEAGLLTQVSLEASPPPLPQPDGTHPGPQLSPDQQQAARQLVATVGAGFSTTLLQGVTGSGKTEVYFEAVAEALKRGQQVLVLVPEITLTTQWLDRFEKRFGAAPLAWHSELTPARRRDGWRAVAEGRALVVVGARSSLFLPYPNLGLIVVDEEHEAAFKQEDGVIYHARDMAVVRGQVGQIPVILASATPSLESMLNADAGRYNKVVLQARHGGAVMPDIAVLDLRKTPPENGDWGRGWLAPPLVQAITETLAAREQAMIFLNRRGYAPLTLCRTCGHRMQCPNCTAWMVEHRMQGRLVCHHCGVSAPIPKECPECGAEDQMTACGPGVERVAEEIQARFPEARVSLVASDTMGGPAALSEALRQITEHEIDIVIGTQVLAKGLHFPMLTLVGVVDADLGLAGGDLRAAERTFQLLSQVAGRAGRAERPGRVLLQSYQPDHPVLQAMATGDTDLFLTTEAEGRREVGMPPYGRMVALILSGPDGTAVESAARKFGARAPNGPGLTVLGPVPAPLAILRGRHRWRMLVIAPRAVKIQAMVYQWVRHVTQAEGWPSSVRVQIDVDPYSFL